jgi:phosphoribosyl-ATP pyrophosphohydrolase
MNDSLERLYATVLAARDRDPSLSRTAKLFREGPGKMAKKLAEEAIEVGLESIQRDAPAMVLESADLLYHLAVIWADAGITPADVAAEIDRRERLYGIAEKLPKGAQHRLVIPMSGRKGAARKRKAEG